jgi:Na+/melibiose symporter-like transporter
MVCAKWRGQWPAAAFGMTMLGSVALHSAFMTYYVEVFRTSFSISPSSFLLAQAVFGLWNALNDPIFGWVSDLVASRSSSQLRARATSIAVGGAVWSLAFLAVWWPWGSGESWAEAAHMALTLCIYDGALTWVEVNHGAALAEMTHDQAERAQANAWSGVWAAIGASASWAAHSAWTNASDLRLFRAVCLCIAVVAVSAFLLSARGIGQGPTLTHARDTAVAPVELVDASKHDATVESVVRERRHAPVREASPKAPPVLPEHPPSWIAFVQQLLHNPNFRIFACMAALQSLDCAFEKNFFGSFLEILAGDHSQPDTVPPNARAGVVSASFLLPHLVTVALTPLVRQVGLYRVLQHVFSARLVFLSAAALATSFLGTAHQSWPMRLWLPSQWTAAIVLLTNRVMSETVCRLFPVVIGDLTDEFVANHPDNPRSMAASMVGTATFLGRFSQSVAPVLGFSLLTSLEAAGLEGYVVYKKCIWCSLILLPLGCVILQSIVWRFFTLHGDRLREVKRSARQHQRVDEAPDDYDV